MKNSQAEIFEPVQNLNKAFLLDYPDDAARFLEKLEPEEVAGILATQQPHIVARVMDRMSPGSVTAVLKKITRDAAATILVNMDTNISITQLNAMTPREREALFADMDKRTANEFRTLLDYPENSVGRAMSPEFSACSRHLTVDEALDLLRRQETGNIKHLFLLNDNMQLDSFLDIHQLVLADGNVKLSTLSRPVAAFVDVMDSMEDVIEKLDKYQVAVMPVVDVNHKMVGIIRSQGLIEALREDLATDMATMVGASRDEKALSSSFFAVKKRQPWLQINLLTAFAASAVVALFEGTIAEFTALAVLLPIAAGQSGNTGAQSLAVTMRGLTVREITMRHWFRVMMKELGAGFVNGVSIALTCSLGVYLWSRSFGLAVVMALAMIISMTIAGTAGAVIPILLKRFGLDPAQSSSIVLTTVTDIAGFMSFLGIATLLSSMLVAS